MGIAWPDHPPFARPGGNLPLGPELARPESASGDSETWPALLRLVGEPGLHCQTPLRATRRSSAILPRFPADRFATPIPPLVASVPGLARADPNMPRCPIGP